MPESPDDSFAPEVIKIQELEDCPMRIMKEAVALVDYYYAPHMNAVVFEMRLDRLKQNIEREIDSRMRDARGEK